MTHAIRAAAGALGLPAFGVESPLAELYERLGFDAPNAETEPA